MKSQWTPEMVAAVFAMCASDYPKFFRDDGPGVVAIVRKLITDRNVFKLHFATGEIKRHRIEVLRTLGKDAWREQVYRDVAKIMNGRMQHGQEETPKT